MRFFGIYVFSVVLMLLTPAFCMADDENAPVWSYDDDYTGQEDWGAIPVYETCRSGMEQSPINISYTKLSDLPRLNFEYSKATGSLNITNKSFIMKITKGGTFLDGKVKYTLQNIEIHSPSGHKVKSAFYPLEIHLIHKNDDGNLLIVAVFANIGYANRSIDDILKPLFSNKAEQFTADLTSLLNNLESYYSYSGSLPYPPCTENVQWRIIKNTITVSSEQLSKITKIIGRNTRLPQPIYMRDVLENTP